VRRPFVDFWISAVVREILPPVSQENLEVVRRIYRAWETDSTPVDSGLLDSEVEWVNPPEAVEPGTRKGIDSFRDAAESVSDTFEEASVDIEEFLDAGDRIVVIATLRGRGRGSGADVERRQGYVWTLRDGRAIRFQWFNSPEQALEAADLHC
jgi:ketosteroid isomerase-like protein